MFINHFNLPLETFGLYEIKGANRIHDCLASNSLEGKYLGNRQIVLLNSSHLSQDLLQKKLYQKEFALNYKYLYPKIEKRDSEENWLISFVLPKPKHDPYLPPSQFLQSKYQIDDLKTYKKLIPAFSFENFELEAMQQRIGHEVVQAMQKIMQGNFYYPEDFRKTELAQELFPEGYQAYETGYLNSSYFTKTKPYHFTLKPHKKPSKAIRQIFEGPSIIDCGMAASLAFLKAILEILGDQLFDQYYFTGYLTPFDIAITPLLVNSLSLHFVRVSPASMQNDSGTIGNRPLKVGDFCSFGGVPCYPIKHPTGSFGGYNVVYAGLNEEGQQTFIGHGFAKALTEQEIYNLFIEEYNREKTQDDLTHSPSCKNLDKAMFYLNFATIRPEDLQNYTQKAFVKGYCHGFSRRIKPKFLLAILKAKDLSAVKANLEVRAHFYRYTITDGGNYPYPEE